MPTARPLAASTCANGSAIARSPASIAATSASVAGRGHGSQAQTRSSCAGGEQVGVVALGRRLEHDVRAGRA